jgi:hypothetical protein
MCDTGVTGCDIGASAVVRLDGYLCRPVAGLMIHLLPQFGEVTSIVVFLWFSSRAIGEAIWNASARNV